MKNRFLHIVNKEYFCNKINLAGSEKPNSKQSRKLNMNDYEKVVNKHSTEILLTKGGS